MILANRAFVDHDDPDCGLAAPAPSGGGLLTTLRPVIAPWDGGAGTTWIGAGRGPFDRHFVDAEGYETIETRGGPLRHRRLFFDDATWTSHYAFVSNGFFWPLLHLVRAPLHRLVPYYPAPATPSPEAWAGYERVNTAFAEAALQTSGQRTCWVHDYQLALVPALLRQGGFAGRVGFFLHTPFPDLDIALDAAGPEGAPAFRRFVKGILGADLAGFQTAADRDRFAAAAGRLGATATGDGLTFEGRRLLLGVHPVGIDPQDVEAALAGQADVPTQGPPLVAGLERCDFTKGIPERLAAVARGFRAGLQFRYEGVAAPTRLGVAAYEHLAQAIDAAARVAASTAGPGQSFRHTLAAHAWPDVVSLQRAASVIFTSSLGDGMNLVPLQGAIAQAGRPLEARGVLITGRDAGLAHCYSGFERDGLISVDPLDPDAMFRTLKDAVEGALPRISDRLIAAVRARDAQSWATKFLSDLEATPC